MLIGPILAARGVQQTVPSSQIGPNTVPGAPCIATRGLHRQMSSPPCGAQRTAKIHKLQPRRGG
eukprot:15206840-Heterocapsa_arctica.AAC.1